ncbi:MAG: polyprenyl synthetase family protein [Actinomycetes bacterium]|nr:polyprenyl synthetase family protein [Actinomycetes bacterium]
MPRLSFELYLKRQHAQIDRHLADYFNGEQAASGDMVRYLYAPLAEYSANSGKRHRPLICLLSCEAVGGDPALALRSAAAIEHFHTAALIHDDIEDDATTRRDEPCYHIKEGEALAINAGDLALSLVTGSVVADPLLDDATKIRVLRELVDMTTRTIEGQALDIGWVRDDRYDLSIDDYLLMARHKTAFYSGAIPLAVGAIIGGADDATVEALRDFGMATGLAFQIQDDILNLDGADRSKDFRADITEGKRTLIALHALAHADAADRTRLLELLRAHTDDAEQLADAVDIMRRAGSLDYARHFAADLVHGAKARLTAALAPSRARELLLSMGDFFIQRSK